MKGLQREKKYAEDLLMKVASGKIYDLEHPRFQGMPIYPLSKPGFFYSLFRHHRGAFEEGKTPRRTTASGNIFMMDQTGTHIDALCHQAYDLKLHGELSIDLSIETPWGFTRLGAETIAPIIRRGLLLDIASLHGRSSLQEGYLVSKKDLLDTCRKEGVTPSEGDVVLVRTGSGQFWTDESRYLKSAGVSLKATEWLGEKKVFAVGADNLSWEDPTIKDRKTGENLLCHIHLLVRKGIYIIENLRLEELSAARCFVFLFIGLPIKIKGATGTPIRPIAIGAPSKEDQGVG
jgi:kynurenine formamidase|tara:strand:- start:3278 stop:4147 length:870 start_codon:yes stop_codon:yes gene_type:complete